jgi:hypothetical protein
MNFAPVKKQLVGLGLVAAIGFGTMGSSVFAQDAQEFPEGVITHPAHVHVGSCAELDPNPAFPLNNVGPRLTDDNEMPAPEDVKGSLSANPVMISETEIDVNLDDLLETAHAINVHASDQDIATYIACGDIGGPLLDDDLYIGMNQQNDSGIYGVAKLEKEDGDKTKVTIYLFDSAAAPAEGTPAA